MAAADVEGLFRWLSAHSYPNETGLSEGLSAALAEEVITRIRGLGEQKRALLRDIRGVVQRGPEQLTRPQVQTLDDRVAAAGSGPLYFNLVLIVYPVWSEDTMARLSPPPTPGSESSDSQDLPEMPDGVRRTGRTRLGGTGARMSLLLQQMRGFV